MQLTMKTLESKCLNKLNFKINWTWFNILMCLAIICNMCAFGITLFVIGQYPEQFEESNPFTKNLIINKTYIRFIIYIIKISLMVTIYEYLKTVFKSSQNISAIKYVCLTFALYFVTLGSIYNLVSDLIHLILAIS